MKWFQVFAGMVVLAMTAAGAGLSPAPGQEGAVRPAVPVAVQRVALPRAEFHDEATMVLVGVALIGVAAVVRRAA
jgi:hypothetical protein